MNLNHKSQQTSESETNMKELLQALVSNLGSPKTFADVMVKSIEPDRTLVQDLISLLVLESLENTVENRSNFTGIVPLKFLIQTHKIENLKMVPVSDWVALCKKLDQTSLTEEERLLLLCAISLAVSKNYSSSCKLFSMYLLDTM